MMEDNFNGSFYFRVEDREDSTEFMYSTGRSEYTISPPIFLSHRQRSLFEIDIQEHNFPYRTSSSELPYEQSIARPTGSLNVINEEPASSSLILELYDSQLESSLPRRESMLTLDESISSSHPRSNLGSASDSKSLTSGIQYASISIGHFNSINAKMEKNVEESDKKVKSAPGKCCKCQKTRCLKLYCECFASDEYCQGCDCVDCHNTKAYELERKKMWRKINERSTFGIKRKAVEKPEEACCNCKKTGCSKKYCECYKKGLKCGAGCNCHDCTNNNALRIVSSLSYKETSRILKKGKFGIV